MDFCWHECRYFVWFSHYRASVSLNTINWLVLATLSVFCEASHQRSLLCWLHFTIQFKIHGPLPQMRPDYLRLGPCFASLRKYGRFHEPEPEQREQREPWAQVIRQTQARQPHCSWVIPDHRTTHCKRQEHARYCGIVCNHLNSRHKSAIHGSRTKWRCFLPKLQSSSLISFTHTVISYIPYFSVGYNICVV